VKIEETQLGLQTSLDTRTWGLCEEIAGTKKDLRKELDLRIQGTQVEMETGETYEEVTEKQ
jgi:hypothetical protein